MEAVALRLRTSAALFAVLMSVLVLAGSAAARGGDSSRIEVRSDGACGRSSSSSLRLRAEDGRIRVDMHVQTSKRGLWTVTVFHERTVVPPRARVRATSAQGGFEYRVFVPDFAGADAIRVRAVAPRGESCTATATVPGS